MRTIGALLLALFAASAHAQRMEAGEWNFVSEIVMPGLPRPQQSASTACLSREQARDPLHWSPGARLPSDCSVGTVKLGPDATSWELECPQSGMRGAGKAQISRGSMSSELQMTGGVRTKTRGMRLGPCKP
ncbi:MAG: DUF3617 domain-containing protein [Betaproteobacteria bacterium]|nr:DUF3617 domain-containing protein [Betaproteobacteria bacterium]